MSNIYQKLQKARSIFHKTPLRKSGVNKFDDYSYFELGDFLVEANDACYQAGLTPVFNIDEEYAQLVVHDWDSENVIIFESPVASAAVFKRDGSLKGTAIQVLGSQHTYMKRYLYMNMMEIAENDQLEAQEQQSNFHNQQSQANFSLATEDQVNEIFWLFDQERIKGMLKYYGVDRIQDIRYEEAEKVIIMGRKEKEEKDKEAKKQPEPDFEKAEEKEEEPAVIDINDL